MTRRNGWKKSKNPFTFKALALAAWALKAFAAGPTLILSADGFTAYDSLNNITWLADANLPSTNRFGLLTCAGSVSLSQICINDSGSMTYPSAAAWVAGMNAVNYLGHNNWQLPTTPLVDVITIHK